MRYLKDRFLARVSAVKGFVFINGKADDLAAEIARISTAISRVAIDVAFVGIGENGHLAFNDPPADFETDAAFITVSLDQKCRAQQAGEGWFDRPDDVPERAITMSIRQIIKSAAFICTVPDSRKAEAVRWTVEGNVSNLFPASILQSHRETYLYLDEDSASELSR